MTKWEDDCVGCKSIYGNCIGPCGHSILVCDNCEEEADVLYDTDDGELCEECLLDSFSKITLD